MTECGKVVTFPAVPIVETDRLLMRGRTIEDFPFFAEIWADERVTRYISKHSQSASETWGKFLKASGHWPLMGYGYWVVELKATGEVLGEVGFGEFKRELDPSIFGEPEIGWVLGPASFGKGYATEAARAAISWGDDRFKQELKMSCLIDPNHTASINVAKKCGFMESFRTNYMDEDVLVLHRNIPKTDSAEFKWGESDARK